MGLIELEESGESEFCPVCDRRWRACNCRIVKYETITCDLSRLAETIAAMPLPDAPHSDAWQLGFCRARKLAAERIDAFAKGAADGGE